jgi:hypothetical protein
MARRVSRPNSTPSCFEVRFSAKTVDWFESLAPKLPLHSVTDLIQNILENLIDGYDTDFISVSSDRVDTRPRGPCRRGINKEVKKENAFG